MEKHLKEKELEDLKNLLQGIDHLPHRKWVKLMNRIEKEYSFESSPDIYEIAFIAFLKELFPSFELFSRRFPRVTYDLYRLSEEEYRNLSDLNKSRGLDVKEEVREAGKSIFNDKTYLDFPEKNVIAFKASLEKRKKEEEV